MATGIAIVSIVRTFRNRSLLENVLRPDNMRSVIEFVSAEASKHIFEGPSISKRQVVGLLTPVS
jgi:hypothetical protein